MKNTLDNRTLNQTRPIDRRFERLGLPQVAGLDLVQALNYIDVADAGEDFVYNHYTSSRIFYKRGSRPKLEEIANRVTKGCNDELAKVKALAQYIPREMPWAGVYTKQTGKNLPADRNLTEEELIESGFGWCNEQARVFCCLAQIVGVLSRLVFASSNEGWGHVTSEVLLPDGWMLVDQTIGFCFEINGKSVRAVDACNDEKCREYFAPIYKEAVAKCRENIAPETGDGLLRTDTPIECFRNIGVHNHFVL